MTELNDYLELAIGFLELDGAASRQTNNTIYWKQKQDAGQ